MILKSQMIWVKSSNLASERDTNNLVRMYKQTLLSCRLQILWQWGWGGRQSFGPAFASLSSSGWSGLKPGFHVIVSRFIFVLIFSFVFEVICWSPFLPIWLIWLENWIFWTGTCSLCVYQFLCISICIIFVSIFWSLVDLIIIWLIWLEIWTSFVISCWIEDNLFSLYVWTKKIILEERGRSPSVCL